MSTIFSGSVHNNNLFASFWDFFHEILMRPRSEKLNFNNCNFVIHMIVEIINSFLTGKSSRSHDNHNLSCIWNTIIFYKVDLSSSYCSNFIKSFLNNSRSFIEIFLGGNSGLEKYFRSLGSSSHNWIMCCKSE